MAIIEIKNKNKITKDGRKYYYDTYYTDLYGNRKEKNLNYLKQKKKQLKPKENF